MTDEEIKKLAWSASEGMYKGYEEMIIASMEEEFKLLISFILKDYCIVPKSKVKEIDNIVCDTFSIGNIAVRQSWEYVKRKLFNDTEK